MGLLNEARREFTAAPDSAKGQIVYKWPDQNIAFSADEPGETIAVPLAPGRAVDVVEHRFRRHRERQLRLAELQRLVHHPGRRGEEWH
jgi:hypothetical protein